VDLSGVIFVMLAVAWAVYLIPKTLKQHDEVARTRSLDRFSGSERVLAGREPVNSRDSRLVVHPSVPATRSVTTVAPAGSTPVTTVAPGPTDSPASAVEAAQPVDGFAVRPLARRTAARVAARRRRRVLLGLLLCVALTGAAAYLSRLPAWPVAVPAVLVVAHLVLCRIFARRTTHRAGSAAQRRRAGRSGVPVDVADPTSRSVPPPASEDTPAQDPLGSAAASDSSRSGSTAVSVDPSDGPHDQEDTVGIPAAEMHARLHAGPDADSGTLWDPLPVTLPTYVTKPKARRTVRTIDLGEPGTWTSGRTQEDAEIAARATGSPDATAADDESSASGRRVVGG
jgi:hypothetical protein